mmetsp:Transcript_21653/g.52129  ORF Transcript_21653/g.52129 Transcript_21653/m.52129 type:complete len:212 (+) Transcript_21653:151-786(+)
MSRSMSPRRSERETRRRPERKMPFTLRVNSWSRGFPRAASTMIKRNCPPSSAGSGIEFMIPRFSEMSAMKVRIAPCLPASAPIVMTPIGPARLVGAAFPPANPCTSFTSPPAVCEKARLNSRLVSAAACIGESGRVRSMRSMFGASRTPITPSPLELTSGVRSRSSSPPFRSTTRCIVFPLLFFTADTSMVGAVSVSGKMLSSDERTTSPA